jgi:hypothetical protein
MTLYEFNALPPREREVATMNGEFLADRREADQAVALYGVHNFYVEIWYNGSTNEITGLSAFWSLELLSPYLEDIRFDLRY